MRLLRPVDPQALLQRPPIAFDPTPVAQWLADRRVLVTGAGGSIGSELCRQIARFHPASLAMVDRAELGLDTVARELAACHGAEAVMADVTDAARLAAVYARVKPEIVFHAAAHKHVPLMERHPSEAVKNNVLGTRLVVEGAARAGAARVVLISTDKAVEPTSIMGASKAAAERLVQGLARQTAPALTVVRFGNVLGSSGSVLPMFLEQIGRGGPVTVTHPEVERFFMLTSEAVELVLQAGALGSLSALCVLDLGKPIRIGELARDVIQLAGCDPDHDMPVTYIGLRPGEKLFERLIGPDEWTTPIGAGGHLLEVRSRGTDSTTVASDFRALERAALRGDDGAVVRRLSGLVPSFVPSELWRHAAAPRPRSVSWSGSAAAQSAPDGASRSGRASAGRRSP